MNAVFNMETLHCNNQDETINSEIVRYNCLFM